MPPLILVLDERRIGPPHDLRGEQVRLVEPYDSVMSNSASRRESLLMPTSVPLIHSCSALVGAAHVQHDAPVGPLTRDVEGGAVATGRVLRGNVRRELVERHDHVRVDRPVEALHGPAARHGHVGPRAVVEVRRARIRRAWRRAGRRA